MKKISTRISLGLLVLLIGLTESLAQSPGTLDTNFGVSGVRLSNVSTSDDEVLALATQSDNKIVVVGYSEKPQQFTVARYTSNGTLDSTFGTGGVVKTAFSERAYAWSVAIQSDGKIVVGGDGGFVFALTRYTSTGALDTTFGNQGKVTTQIGNMSAIRSIAIQSDGKIVAAGYSDFDFAVARYTTTGSLDSAFGGGDGIVTTDFYGDEDKATSIRLQSDGKILVAGSAVDLDLSINFAIARYNSDGTADTSFNSTGSVTTVTQCGVEALGLQPDGKIVVTGSTDDVLLARYTTSGALDTLFGTDGIVTTNVGGNPDRSAALYTDTMGNILIAGSTLSGGNEEFFAAKYQSSGVLDGSFDNGDGIVITSLGSNSDLAYAIGVQPNGGIILGGSQGDFGDKQFGLIRYIGLQPTAASVTVTGRITRSNGAGVYHASVGLTNQSGVTVYALTNPFGYYVFNNVQVGHTYIVTPHSKSYTFDPSYRLINVLDELTDVNFIGIEE